MMKLKKNKIIFYSDNTISFLIKLIETNFNWFYDANNNNINNKNNINFEENKNFDNYINIEQNEIFFLINYDILFY